MGRLDQIDTKTLHDLLKYDPENGLLTWRYRGRDWFGSDREWNRWNTRYAGKPAFTAVDKSGYHHGTLLSRGQLAHRVIWKMMTGIEPTEIDHEDQVKTNNRWANLREVAHRENCLNQRGRRNNTSGYHGVSWVSAAGKWVAQISINGRNTSLGLYETAEAAAAVRAAANIEHGYHPNHGRKQDERN